MKHSTSKRLLNSISSLLFDFPTFQTHLTRLDRSSAHSTIDLSFCAPDLVMLFRRFELFEPDTYGSCADHRPFKCTFCPELIRNEIPSRHRLQFNRTNWVELNASLQPCLAKLGERDITTTEDFKILSTDFSRCVNDHIAKYVPVKIPSLRRPTEKRWWNPGLTILKKKLNKSLRLNRRIMALQTTTPSRRLALKRDAINLSREYYHEIRLAKQAFFDDLVTSTSRSGVWTTFLWPNVDLCSRLLVPVS